MLMCSCALIMFNLTKQERLVLLIFILIIVVGMILQYSFKKFPRLAQRITLIDSETVYPKIDLNQAGVEELDTLPFIGKVTAQRIVDYRRDHGKFLSLEELKIIRGISEDKFKKIAPFFRKIKPES